MMSTQEQTQPAELVDYTTGEIRQNLSRRDIDEALLSLFEAELHLTELEIAAAEMTAAAAEAKDAADQADKDEARELKRRSQALNNEAREIQAEVDGQTKVVRVMREEVERTGDLKVDSLGWYRHILRVSLAACTARKQSYYRDYQRAGGREKAVQARIDGVSDWVRSYLERTERTEIEGRQWRPRLESTGKYAVRVVGETEEERKANAIVAATAGFGTVQLTITCTGDADELAALRKAISPYDCVTNFEVRPALDEQAVIEDRLAYEQRLSDAIENEHTVEPWPLDGLVEVTLGNRLMWREVTR